MTSQGEPKVESLYDAAAIRQRVEALGRRVAEDYQAADPLVLSLAGGSVVFVADLVRAIDQPIRFEFVQVQYAAAGPDGDILEIHYPISLGVKDQSILIVRDVSTSGVIENYLSTQFLQHGAHEVCFASLIDVPTERKTDFEPDYSLFVAEGNHSFVGYGLKYRGLFGNLAYIGQILEEEEGI